MAKTIKVDEIGRLIDEEPFHISEWFNYDLGGGFGGPFNDRYMGKQYNRGAVIQGINKDISVQTVMRLADNGDFDDIAGFYPAIFLFFGHKFIDKVDFCDGSSRNRISRLIDSLKGPKHLKSDIYDFVHRDFDFLSFLKACGRNKKLSFNLDSAISVYKLQGDDAIFGILCQIFYVNKGVENLDVRLIDSLPICWSVEVSNFLSGCHFPVVVSPSVSGFEWVCNQNGWFLCCDYGGERRVLDVAGVGGVNLSNYALANRINFLGGGGLAVPYLVCWNWGEIIDAYHYFNSDLLVRDLRNDLFSNYWFNFGLHSYLNVEFQNNLINERSNYEIAVDIDMDIPTGQKFYITVQLNGKFVQYCEQSDICYSKSEVYDWFEIGNMLKQS